MKRGRVFTLLVACVLALQLVSCGKVDETETSDTVAQDMSSDLTKSEKTYDLGGYTLNIAKVAQSSVHWILVTFGADEETGEILNDAIVRRNRQTMEKNNFQMKETEFESSAVPTIQKLVNAGDDEYQVVFDTVIRLGGAINDGIFLDVSTVKSLELDNPCWDQNLSSLSVGDSTYIIGGDITVSDEDGVEVIVYNTSYARELQVEDLYSVVREGKWTVDRMLDAAKLAVSDINGDTVMDLEDSYGVISSYDGISAMLISCGVSAVAKDANGTVALMADSERYADAFESLSRLYNKEVWHTADGFSADDHVSRLETNRSLFTNAVTSFARRFLRDVKTDFGFLPTPKLDEKQENYYSAAVNSTCALAMPSLVADPETAGLALELLAEASGDITSAYYDICLQSKYTRDEESYEMLKISTENIIYDIGYIYGAQFANLHEKLVQKMMNGKSDISSTIASCRDAVEIGIKKYTGE